MRKTDVLEKMVTPTMKCKYEEVEMSEMMVCNSATVHSVFIVEVSLVKHSRTKIDVAFFEGSILNGADGVFQAQAKDHSRETKR